VGIAIAAVVVVAGPLTWQFWPASSTPPYAPSAVHARANLRVVTPDDAQEAADRLAGPGRLNVVYPVGDSPEQVLLGQLTLRTPPNAPADGEYVFALIDNNDHEPLEDIYAVGPHPQSTVAQGWEGRYQKIAERYPKLAAFKAILDPDGGGWRDPGMAVSFPATTRGPITYTAALGSEALPVSEVAARFTAVLALFGRNETLYWATVLPL
jgi:hypothetical protein